MAILISPDPTSPLQQGDVLEKVTLFYTGLDGSPVSIERDVVVLSRPCNALRDKLVTVAPIVERPLPALRDATDLDELIRAFTRIRDGEGQKDLFYLGPKGSPRDKRYAAQLSTLYTLEVPVENTARAAYLQQHRQHALAPEFARDLHLRILGAYASLGFDDDGWWSDDDLALVVSRGEALRSQAEARVQTLESALEVHRVSGGNQREEKKLSEELALSKKQASSAREALTGLHAERQRRTSR
jgi:hypothetical protein